MKFTEIISDGSKKGIAVGLFHLLLIILAYTSPLWLAWRFVAIGVGLLFLQQLIFGNCILNASQYGGDANGRFYQNLLTHFHIGFEEKRLRIWLMWIIPIIVLAVGFVVQTVGLRPLVGL